VNIPSRMKWPARMAMIIVAVAGLDAAGVLLLPHPWLWAAVVPGLAPLLTICFIVMPMTRAKGR